MIKSKLLSLSMAASACVLSLAAVPTTASAATFFGQDLNPGGAITAVPLAARNNFVSQLSGVRIEDFTGFATNSQPSSLSFTGSSGTINAAFSPSSGTILGAPLNGRFATSPSQYFNVTSSNFGLTFSSEVAAFGFYGTDIGDFAGQLTLTLLRTGRPNEVLTIPHTIGSTNGAGSGSLLFFGVIDRANPFNGVRFGNTAAGTDVFGFDDLIIGDARQVTGAVPEPATWLSMIAGFGLMGFAMRRGKQQTRVRFAF